jgi:hypothetical protein
MNASALRHLRFLYDNDDVTFAVLLVGVNFRRLVDLVPEIDSRVTAESRSGASRPRTSCARCIRDARSWLGPVHEQRQNCRDPTHRASCEFVAWPSSLDVVDGLTHIEVHG